MIDRQGYKHPIFKKEVLEKLYVNQKLSSHSIARMLGTTHSSVLQTLKANNIPTRKSSDYKRGRNCIHGFNNHGLDCDVCASIENRLYNMLAELRSLDIPLRIIKDIEQVCKDKIASVRNKIDG